MKKAKAQKENRWLKQVVNFKKKNKSKQNENKQKQQQTERKEEEKRKKKTHQERKTDRKTLGKIDIDKSAKYRQK